MAEDIIIETLKKQLEGFSPGPEVANVGKVIKAGDGIASISGLSQVMASEMLEFKTKEGTVSGMALNLEENQVGAIVLGDFKKIKEGD